jgi:hypothetical protein
MLDIGPSAAEHRAAPVGRRCDHERPRVSAKRCRTDCRWNSQENEFFFVNSRTAMSAGCLPFTLAPPCVALLHS